MSFDIIWNRKAAKELGKVERPVAKRIYNAVSALSEDPFRQDVKKLVNSPWYRLRVGDYRVIMDIRHDKLVILVLQVGHRRQVYKR